MLTQYAYTPYALPLAAAAILTIWLSYMIWRQREHVLNKTFSLLMAASATWAFMYMMAILASELETQVFWEKMKYLGIVFVGPLWLAFALYYAQQGRWLRLWWLRALIVLEVFSLIGVFTNELHSLWWSNISPAVGSPFYDLTMTRGTLFWLHTAFSYGFLITGFLFYLNFYRQMQERYKRQTQVVLVAMLIPLLGNVLVLFGGIPEPISSLDVTPFMLAITGILVVSALFQYRFLDLRPVARIAVFEQIEDGIIILDEQQRVVDVNPAAQKMLRIDLQRALGVSVIQALPHEHLKSTLQHILSTRAAESGSQKIKLEHGGRNRTIEVSISDLAAEHNPSQAYGHLLSLHDISDQQQVQHLTAQMMRMTAHDLRSPLALAVGYLSLVAEDELPAHTSANLEIVADALDRIENLINDLLDLERVRSGVGMLLGNFEPAGLAKQVYKDLRPLALARGHDFSLEVEDELPSISGDERLVQQALSNLVSNGIKYTPKEGVIGLKVHWEQGELVFSVKDNGYGISEEAQTHLFEPFFRAPETKNLQIGSGLGLSLVKAIVEAHGGRVWARSEFGKGSAFGFSLPVEAEGLSKRPLSKR